ncbi:acyl carrier protein phosphodiesterase [Paraglaciecola aestuariivivens]
MNYIAHLHIAEHTQTSLLGNFLGDFVKGSQLNHLPKPLIQGIKLHRSVDVFTDSHPAIAHCKSCFPKNLRRMAGVILDIYFDHLLMQNWRQYSSTSYQAIFARFYQQLANNGLPINGFYTQVATRLMTHQWLDQYQHKETYYKAMQSIEKRLKNKLIFADNANLFITNNSEFLESSFHQFYPDCLDYSKQVVESNHQTLSK